MKKSKRIVSIMLVLVTLISILSVSVSASNYQNRDFYNFTLFDFPRFLTPRDKEDDTPCYVCVTSALINQPIYIRAHGFKIPNINDTEDVNLTRDGYGNYVPSVVIQPYQHYRIRNMIFEFEYPYASLGFRSPEELGMTNGYGNEVSGVWSPDSLGNYQYAYGE